MAVTPVFSPGGSHGQRSLAGSSPRGLKESDRTENSPMLPDLRPAAPFSLLPPAWGAGPSGASRPRPRTAGR